MSCCLSVSFLSISLPLAPFYLTLQVLLGLMSSVIFET
jgi:hypothetical protein